MYQTQGPFIMNCVIICTHLHCYWIFPSPFTFSVLVTYLYYLHQLHRLLYHTQLNIFFTFPDDATKQKKLEIRSITIVAQGLNQVIYLLWNAIAGPLLTIRENRGSWCFQSSSETRRPMMMMIKVTKWYNKMRDYETFDDKDVHWKSKCWKPRLF